jgi:hypothetical protein
MKVLEKYIKLMLFIVLVSVSISSYSSISDFFRRLVQHPQEQEGITSSIDAKILKIAHQAYEWAKKNRKIQNDKVITIFDFSLASNQKRAWVIDLKTNKILMNFYVSHGKNSGGHTKAYDFSNQPSSKKTSLGIYTTEKTYYGKHGYSLRLDGLEKGINDNAKTRAIVVHPASYMTTDFIKQHGYAGRSWGCFAMSPTIIERFIEITRGGSLLFAYAPLYTPSLEG